MMDAGIGVLALAFGLGLLHALDADHLLTVCGLSTLPDKKLTRLQRGWSRLRACGHWALGHGLTLLALGALVLIVGIALPPWLGHYAEVGIGIFLIGLGVAALMRLRRRTDAHVHFHRHDGGLPHLHWHTHAHGPAHRHRHAAVLAGIMHGTAGSAGVLALVPVATSGDAWLGIAYLLSFAVGVLVAMLVFGGALSGLAARLANRPAALATLRALLAVGTIGFGSYWLYAAR
jgi:cytochrome c biogenesis protein CcdA